MSIPGISAGYYGYKAASSFGRDLIKGWLSKAPKEVAEGLLKNFGKGISPLPGIGVAQSIWHGIFKGGYAKTWNMGKGYFRDAVAAKSLYAKEFKSMVDYKSEFAGAVKSKFPKEFVDDRMSSTLENFYMGFGKSLKYNPKEAVSNLQSAWNANLGSITLGGIDLSKITMKKEWLESPQRVMNASHQAQESKKLFNTVMRSNLAVVGIPTLTSGVSTYFLMRYSYNRVKRRLDNV